MVTLDVDFGIALVRVRPNTHPLSQPWHDYLGASPLSLLRWDHLSVYREELLRLVSVSELYQWLIDEGEQQGQGQQGQGQGQGQEQESNQMQEQETEQQKLHNNYPLHRRAHIEGIEGKDTGVDIVREAIVDFRAAAKMFPF